MIRSGFRRCLGMPVSVVEQNHLTSAMTTSINRKIRVFSTNRQLIANNNEDGCPAHIKTTKVDVYTFDKEELDNAKAFKQIPGPKPIPLLGNNWRFLPKIGEFYDFRTDINALFRSIHNTYGDIVRFEGILGQKPAVYLFDPDHIEKVYKVEGVMPERDIIPSMTYFRNHMRQDVYGEQKGLLSSQGEDWYQFRNKVNAIMMQPKMVKQYVEPVNQIAKELVAKIKRKLTKENKLELDMIQELNKYALESIVYIALSTRMNCFEDNLSEDSNAAKIIRMAEELFTIIAKLDFEPNMWRHFSTPLYKTAMKLYDDQVTMGQELIEEAILRIKAKEGIEETNNEEPSVLEKLLKIDQKVAVIMTLDMMLAGVDTTANALITVLYYLATNEDKQEILRNEIQSVLRNNAELKPDHLNAMPYLKACIKESARVYPVTAGVIRNLTKDIVLSGYRLPKGIDVLFPHMYLSSKEDQFPRPTEYIPERWLRENSDSELSYKKAHPFCWMHFGFGARSCIGRRFAELELEVAVINFIKDFRLSWDGPPPSRIIKSINYLKPPFNFVFKDV